MNCNQVFRDSKSDPVDRKIGLIHQKSSSGFLMKVQFPDVDLKNSQISENIDVFGIVLQSIFVAADSIEILSLASVDNAQDVPAKFTLDVFHESL